MCVLVKGEELPGAYVRFRVGYEGNEPREIERILEQMPPGWVRVVMALPSNYECVPGGYHLNRGLIALVQRALSDLGVAVVSEEFFGTMSATRGLLELVADPDMDNPATLVPVEFPGAVEFDQRYVLVKPPNEVWGQVLLWELSDGCGEAFLNDWHSYLDFVLRKTDIETVKAAVRRRCEESHVPFHDCGTAGPKPPPSW